MCAPKRPETVHRPSKKKSSAKRRTPSRGAPRVGRLNERSPAPSVPADADVRWWLRGHVGTPPALSLVLLIFVCLLLGYVVRGATAADLDQVARVADTAAHVAGAGASAAKALKRLRGGKSAVTGRRSTRQGESTAIGQPSPAGEPPGAAALAQRAAP